jgi:hypothetical protein
MPRHWDSCSLEPSGSISHVKIRYLRYLLWARYVGEGHAAHLHGPLLRAGGRHPVDLKYARWWASWPRMCGNTSSTPWTTRSASTGHAVGRRFGAQMGIERVRVAPLATRWNFFPLRCMQGRIRGACNPSDPHQSGERIAAPARKGRYDVGSPIWRPLSFARDLVCSWLRRRGMWLRRL